MPKLVIETSDYRNEGLNAPAPAECCRIFYFVALTHLFPATFFIFFLPELFFYLILGL